MVKPKFYIGLDVSSSDFAASVFSDPKQKPKTKYPFANSPDGFEDFKKWLIELGIDKEHCLVCIEATGVYSEELCYWLKAKDYVVALEQPLKVKRAFQYKGHKTDPIDSKQIAEYAFRYFDQLHYWEPKHDLIEQLRVLLAIREQFIQQRTANKNALKAVLRKVVQTPLANQSLEKNIDNLKGAIEKIESEMHQLIEKEQHFKKLVSFLSSIKSVGFLLSVNFLVISQGFNSPLAVNHRKAAAYIGICPYQHTSGTTVYKRPTSSFMGPSRMRKLLYLAAVSSIKHNPKLREYYLHKVAEGKSKRLTLNNMQNKLLKVMCAIIRTEKPFLKNYVSLHPDFTQKA